DLSRREYLGIRRFRRNMARSGRSEGNTINGKSRTPSKGSGRRSTQRRVRPGDDAGIIPVLARAVREIENAAERARLSPATRTTFQVIALLMREERARAKSDTEVSDADRAELLKRLDGVATILAKAAARDTSLIALL